MTDKNVSESLQKAFEAYVTYIALKQHFNSEYDYVKYNGKVKAKIESFGKVKRRYSFAKLSNYPDYKDRIISCLLNDPSSWVGDILSRKGEKVHQDRLSKIENIGDHVKECLDKLDPKFERNFAPHVMDGAPNIYYRFIRGEISLETLIILLDLTGKQDYFEKTMKDKVTLRNINRSVNNYRPFLAYNQKAMQRLIYNYYYN